MTKSKFTPRGDTHPRSGKAITQMLHAAAIKKGFVAEWWETGGGCDCIGVTPAEFGGGGSEDWASGPHLLISPGNEEVGPDSFGGDDWNHLFDYPRDPAWDEWAVGFYRTELGGDDAESLAYLKGTEALLAHVSDWMDNLGFSDGALRPVEGQDS
jgi:hypothetical protein